MARKKRKYSYWEQRRAREMFDLMETAEETASELKGLYYKASAETESEAIRVIKRFQLKNHLTEKEAYALLEKTRTPEDIRSAVAQLKKNPKSAELAAEVESPAYAARVRELQGVQARVDQTVKDLYRVTKTKTDDTLDYIAKESYYREMFSLQQQVGEAFPIEDMTAEDLERIVRTRWSGASYSERIWKNTQELADAVKEEMLLSVLTGKSLNKIARDIQKKFGGTFNSARRLVRTEACYVTNQIQLEVFKRTGVKEYIYSAILDERTSEICRNLDGRRFKVKNARVGVNYPPMHPWCRSSVVAAMPESLIDRLKRKARDFWGRIRRVPEKMGFREWKASFSDREGLPAYAKKKRVKGPDLEYLLEEDIIKRSNQADGIVNKYIDPEKSEFSGKTIWTESINNLGQKNPDCSISLRPEATLHIAIHEQIHARSFSRHGKGLSEAELSDYYKAYANQEEGLTELLAIEICKAEGIPYEVTASYEGLVNELREIRRKSKAYHERSDLEFGLDLLDIPLEEREAWLRSLE